MFIITLSLIYTLSLYTDFFFEFNTILNHLNPENVIQVELQVKFELTIC